MITDQGRERPGRPQKVLTAGVFGALFGAIVGGIIGASLEGVGIRPGALLGGLAWGVGDAITAGLRRRGQLKPEAWRIFTGLLFGAALGGMLALVFAGINPILLGVIVGTVFGLLGLGMNRLALGAAAGLLVGVTAVALAPNLPEAVIGGLVALLYRLSSRILKRQEPLQLVGERVPPQQVRFVVPFEANSKYVGAEYFRDLARTREGTFKRNAPDIGIVESMECLQGPFFDPDAVDPLIREFYEHTSRFKLHIVPRWRRRMLSLFWLFKRVIARPIGQANLPFDIREAQRGVVSYIDGIDFDCDDIIDLRGWVRAFEATGEAIYVGVYTTFRYDGVGYVSVGFPLPGANFTATLLPYNQQGSDFLLKSHNPGWPFPGHYLSAVERETGDLTVFELPTFGEEIEVYVRAGELRTDHRFYLSGLNFLTLYYQMERA